MIERKVTTHCVVHCADTPADMDIGAAEIRKWHTEDNGWDDIGYHYVIRRDGILENGRDTKMQGAHCAALGMNGKSLGICLVGRGNNITEDQYLTLHSLIQTIKTMYPDVEVIGHSDAEPKKPNCPGFDVKQWIRDEFYG
jgi:N-acetylmuramoyl-L-alanine amidase|tara:strand:- start:2321 stop:2740 length:420 start_codon:yes stop_codon:yes gene_type:complete